MIYHELYLEVVDLLVRSCHALDTDRLEQWVEFFAPDCEYKVITLENIQQGLPAGILMCTGVDMLKDRILYVRKAAVFNPHQDRHVISQPVIDVDGENLRSRTAFAIYQSEPDRESRLFAVGHYDDRIVRTAAGLKLSSRIVVLDNNSIMPLLCSPI